MNGSPSSSVFSTIGDAGGECQARPPALILRAPAAVAPCAAPLSAARERRVRSDVRHRRPFPGCQSANDPLYSLGPRCKYLPTRWASNALTLPKSSLQVGQRSTSRPRKGRGSPLALEQVGKLEPEPLVLGISVVAMIKPVCRRRPPQRLRIFRTPLPSASGVAVAVTPAHSTASTSFSPSRSEGPARVVDLAGVGVREGSASAPAGAGRAKG
jgi:hypothetical protein